MCPVPLDDGDAVTARDAPYQLIRGDEPSNAATYNDDPF